MNELKIKRHVHKLPIYLPDATRAVVKSLDANDLYTSQIEGVVVNTFHLLSYPGMDILEGFGGIKNFMNFKGLVASDSGGWQIFSLIHRNNSKGSITDVGVKFSLGGQKRKELFTPEKSMQVQSQIYPDIMICLDDFTPPNSDKYKIEESVERTIKWARRCKDEYLRICNEKNWDDTTRPLLLAPIQGAENKKYRKICAEGLIDIGFDAYGFGGYPLDETTGQLDMDISSYLANLIPNDKPKFALGLGMPWEIAQLYDVGWDIFDCTLPTRDARHFRLYTFKREPTCLEDLKNKDTYEFVYINRDKHKLDQSAISSFCDCYTCKNYSKGYLQHLFKVKDFTAYRLATLHNLRLYSHVIELMRKFGRTNKE